MKNPRNMLYLAGAALALIPALPAMAATAQATAAFKITGAKPKTVTDSQLAAAQKTATRGAVSADKKTLTFQGKTIRLVVAGGPEDDMLSYRIQGLRNPTLVVPAGAMLKVLYVNTDAHMLHNLRFTTSKPPFPISPGSKGSVGSRNLGGEGHGEHHHGATSVSYPAEEMAIRAPGHKGTYSYLCTVAGHAKGGMYGRLAVR